jgi:hypothetical protein
MLIFVLSGKFCDSCEVLVGCHLPSVFFCSIAPRGFLFRRCFCRTESLSMSTRCVRIEMQPSRADRGSNADLVLPENSKGRQHFWRVVEKDRVSGSINAPCVFLSWEWVYQGVSQRGISTECWVRLPFTVQNCASMVTKELTSCLSSPSSP